MAKDQVDQQRLMGIYQAWNLSELEKEKLGLRGLEWVERPLVRIQFSIHKDKGDGRGRGRGRGGSRGRGRSQRFKRKGIEDRATEGRVLVNEGAF